MYAQDGYTAQKTRARSAFRRVLVSRLARRMSRTGIFRTIVRSLSGFDGLSARFPSQHLHRDCRSAHRLPLRRSGVAAGGAGGGGPGDLYGIFLRAA